MEIIRKTIENDEEYLRQISEPVSFDDVNLQEEIGMLEEFCNATECFALAAVQIGIPKRMVYLKNTTLDVPLDDMSHNEAKVLINPVILDRVGHTTYWEACLSCLDNMGKVSRPYKMTVEYYDETGEVHTKVFEGFEATVLSHELDHLDGILHMDVADEVISMPREDRAKFRETHPYEVLSETCDYEETRKKMLRKAK